MFRRYKISITVDKEIPEIENQIPAELGCTISDPSNWIERGSTEERGLTFTNKKGDEIDSPIFQHQHFFNPGNDKKLKENEEISGLIYSALLENFQLETTEVKVVVNEDDSL